MREQWHALLPHEHIAPLPGGADRTALRRAAETIENWAIRQETVRRDDRQYLDSNPETVLAAVRGDIETEQRRAEIEAAPDSEDWDSDTGDDSVEAWTDRGTISRTDDTDSRPQGDGWN